MKKPRIAIIAFPGSNGETENLRTFWRNGFDAFIFRWNDSREKLAEVDGYFIGAGFSYEDRGRAGMVAARDPLFAFLHEEAEKGKVIVGHCNGCQVLVESGLIPLGKGLKMCMARNITKCKVQSAECKVRAPGFLNEWIYMTRTCARDRCATSDWVDSTGSPYEGVMQIPIAHGEGRFVTKDPDLIAELEENDQVAFRYCDSSGAISEDSTVTPNGSTGAIAGICNPAGNIVAMMPHAERTLRLRSGQAANGDPYFQSMRRWIERGQDVRRGAALRRPVEDIGPTGRASGTPLHTRSAPSLEIFIDTIIVNNEERTVEQAARRVSPMLKLKQFRYLAPTERKPEEVLTTIALFNPNKEVAYVRTRHAEEPGTILRDEPSLRSGSPQDDVPGVSKQVTIDSEWFKWNPDNKSLEPSRNPLSDTMLLRRDEPDVSAQGLGKGSQTGVCYAVSGVPDTDLENSELREIFANPHASQLEQMV